MDDGSAIAPPGRQPRQILSLGADLARDRLEHIADFLGRVEMHLVEFATTQQPQKLVRLEARARFLRAARQFGFARADAAPPVALRLGDRLARPVPGDPFGDGLRIIGPGGWPGAQPNHSSTWRWP